MNVRDELKAYYDNELTPAQAEEVRRALESDPEAMRDLEDFGRISQVLRTETVGMEPYGLEETLGALTVGRRKLTPLQARARKLGMGLMGAAAVLVMCAIVFPIFAQAKFAAKKGSMDETAASTPAMDSAGAGVMGRAPSEMAAGAQRQSAAKSAVGGMNGVVAGEERAASADNASSMAAPSLVVKNAELAVEVASVPEAQQRVESLVRSNRGIIQNSSRIDAGGPIIMSMTLRVPVSRFETILTTVRKLGKVQSDVVSGEDVTSTVADIDARLKVLKSEEEQYRTLMSRANQIGEILQVKERLGQVRQEIESLDAQQRTFRSQAKMSTIQLTLQERSKVQPNPVAPANRTWTQNAWAGATGNLQVLWQSLGTIGIYLLVFAPIWLPLGLVGWLIYRRR